MEITVQKFGGSSLATDQQIDAVAERIAAAHRAGQALAVVVSARGNTTDELVAAAETLHDPARLDAAPTKGTAHRFDGVPPHDAVSARETDQLLATGELVAAALLAIALRGRHVPALSLSGAQAGLRATGRHGAGVVTAVDTAPIRGHLAAGQVVVVAGFQALADSGDVITLGRGGSDISAVVLAVAHGASACEIYTDVNGVYSADPRVVEGARVLPALPAPVMAEMAWSGARVLHPRAVELAATHGVDVVVRHAHRGEPGSTILGRNPMLLEESVGISAVTHEDAVAQVIISSGERRSLSGVEVLDALARNQIAVDALAWSPPTADPRMAFCVPADAVEDVRAALEPVAAAGGGAVEVRTTVGKVSLVGTGLLSRPGITAKALVELAELGIPAECVSSTQARLCFIVPAGRVRDAVVALYHRLRTERDTAIPELTPA